MRKHLNRCLCIVRCVKSKAPGKVPSSAPNKGPHGVPAMGIFVWYSEDKAADIMLKVLARARILVCNTFCLEVYIYATIKMKLSVTDRFYKIYLDKQLAPYGINNSQYMFLIKICRSPGILQDSLLNMFYVHPSNIVRTVATLEKQGMITRSPNDKDKRTCKLYPTERALSIIDEIQMICEKTEALLLQGMSESEQNLFMDFLIQAGRNITSELHIERKGEEFND